MAGRDGKPSMNGEAKRAAASRKSLLFGLSLLAAAAFFDARPAAAQINLNLNLPFLGGGGYYRHHRGYRGHHGGYHRRHHSYRYGYHGGGHRHHGGGHHGGGGGHHGGGGGGGGHAPQSPL